MSFTAQVKDELSRVSHANKQSALAELSAIIRICGTLSFHGSGSWSLRVATETGAVARTLIKLCHELFGLETPLTVRRSNLHRAHNFMIEIRDQEKLEDALIELGILLPGRGIAQGAPQALLTERASKESYVRGAFMAGGFVSDPRGDFHLEVALSGEQLASDVCELIQELGIEVRINHRRGAFVAYLKRFEGIVELLRTLGAPVSAALVIQARKKKNVKNSVNRLVNAEMANQARTSTAATNQTLLIERAEQLIGFRALPPTIREFCLLRRANPELSLVELGKLCNPPVGKSAMHHRAMRLEALVRDAEASSKFASS